MNRLNRTLILFKPETLQNGFVGELLSRFERKKFELTAIESRTVTKELFDAHYKEHLEKDFCPRLREQIEGKKVIAAVLSHNSGFLETVSTVRAMVGKNEQVGTIRGDYSLGMHLNLMHASATPEEAENEIKLWFPEGLKSISTPGQSLKGIYRHYKNGQLYRVLDLVLHTETQQHMVLYEEVVPSERNPDRLRFVRPLEMFTEIVNDDGKEVQRFVKMSN